MTAELAQNGIDYQKLLHGQYEAESRPRILAENAAVPDYAFNVLNLQGLLYRPVVDEHLIQNGMPKMTWPQNKSFAVCLTHDVDEVSRYAPKQAIRRLKSRLATAASSVDRWMALLGAGVAALRAIGHRSIKDPLFCYERWLAVEKAFHSHATFFFWPGVEMVTTRHHSDCSYSLSDSVVFEGQKCSVSEMIQEIDRRGWEVGLHPSWYTYSDADELKRQKAAIENVVKHEIVSVRQHFLHYDIRLTPRVHSQAGFKYDSTLGFNDNIGFRFGTCYPWQLCDVTTLEALPIIEVPLIIQDGALLMESKGMRLDEDMAFLYIQRIAQAVADVGGVLTLLWHPHSILEPAWWRLYLKTLDYLAQRDAWFGSVQEIMTYYTKQKQASA